MQDLCEVRGAKLSQNNFGRCGKHSTLLACYLALWDGRRACGLTLIFTVRRVQNLESDGAPHTCIFFFSIPQQLLWFLLLARKKVHFGLISPFLLWVVWLLTGQCVPSLSFWIFSLLSQTVKGEVEGTVMILWMTAEWVAVEPWAATEPQSCLCSWEDSIAFIFIWAVMFIH